MEQKAVTVEQCLHDALWYAPYRQHIYVLMAGGEAPYSAVNLTMLRYLEFTSASRNNNRKAHLVKLFLFLYDQGYICFKEHENKYRIPNEEMKEKFLQVLRRYYEEEYDISEESVKDCSKLFIEMLTCVGEDPQVLTTVVQKIKHKVQALLTERVFANIAPVDKYLLLDVICLPLFETGYKCTVIDFPFEFRNQVDVALYRNRCAVMIKLNCSQANIAAHCFRSIYKINFEKVLASATVFPDGVEQYVVIVFNLNTDNNYVSVCCLHSTAASS